MEIRIIWCAKSYYNPLQLVIKRLEENLIGKLEGKGKKASPTMLQAFLLQCLFLTLTNCKTPAESNASLVCMCLFQVCLNCFM